MMVIPDESGRVKRLRTYERELNCKLMFDEKFSKTLSENGRPSAHEESLNDLHRVIGSDIFLTQL